MWHVTSSRIRYVVSKGIRKVTSKRITNGTKISIKRSVNAAWKRHLNAGSQRHFTQNLKRHFRRNLKRHITKSKIEFVSDSAETIWDGLAWINRTVFFTSLHIQSELGFLFQLVRPLIPTPSLFLIRSSRRPIHSFYKIGPNGSRATEKTRKRRSSWRKRIC